MTKRNLILFSIVLLVVSLTTGLVSAQGYWSNPWNSSSINTGNPFVNTSPMYQQPQTCYSWQNCYVPPASTWCGKPNCATFVADVTIADGSYVAPGTVFTKTWRIRNNGSVTWNTNYKLIYVSGTQMNAPSWVALPHNVAPGQTVDITVNMTAPATSGTYRANFKLQSDSGEIFGVGYNCDVPIWAEIRTYAYSAPSYNPCYWWYGCYNYYDWCGNACYNWNWGSSSGPWTDFTPWW